MQVGVSWAGSVTTRSTAPNRPARTGIAGQGHRDGSLYLIDYMMFAALK